MDDSEFWCQSMIIWTVSVSQKRERRERRAHAKIREGHGPKKMVFVDFPAVVLLVEEIGWKVVAVVFVSESWGAWVVLFCSKK